MRELAQIAALLDELIHRTPELEVVLCNDRFTSPTPLCWSDVMLYVVVVGERATDPASGAPPSEVSGGAGGGAAFSNWPPIELQIVLAPFAATLEASHDEYDSSRLADELRLTKKGGFKVGGHVGEHGREEFDAWDPDPTTLGR